VIDILVVSDIKIYCEGLHRIFAGEGTINVVGAVSNREAALTFAREHRPHVVLLDMTMNRSCELARLLAAAGGHTKIVALAVPHDDQDILRCAEAGITAYVLRESSTEELVEAVKQAADGGCYCPPRIVACILRKIESQASAGSEAQPPPIEIGAPAGQMPLPGSLRLTPREQQIMPLLAEGLTNKEIARELCIEVSTVKNHVHNVLLKLEARSRSQAISLLQKLLKQPRLPYGSLDLDPSLPMTRL
jgi:DNA-binding NarL/FixJ family response regulator